MTKNEHTSKLQARLVAGFQDSEAGTCVRTQTFLKTIAQVYAAYGFDQLDTPALEYADALGQFLPDDDRPNQGVFVLKDDAQWVCLRYDLTAPLARYVAMNGQNVSRPFKRYQIGSVWRNEKPGPGRFREFIQADADIVNTDNILADAELCCMLSHALTRLGFPRHEVRVSNRKILDALLEKIGLTSSGAQYEPQKLTILRAIDKFDKLGEEGVALLLGAGRLDPSGDYTPGANLEPEAVRFILDVLLSNNLSAIEGRGAQELSEVVELCNNPLIRPNLSIVRGLAYYTGTVFEAVLTGESSGSGGGAVASGGRYDTLIERFLGQKVPSVGCSIGVSRLLALSTDGEVDTRRPVCLLVLDRPGQAEALALASQLRARDIPCDIYTGTAGLQGQLKYAAKRGFSLAVIRGEDERAQGVAILKDLLPEDLVALKENQDRQAWLMRGKQKQKMVPFDELVDTIAACWTNNGSLIP